MADTTHLVLPLLAAAQAQKHVTHNDALLRLDALVQLTVKDRDLTSPPASPADGDRYIPASGATGDWSGWDLNVAWYADGVWTKLVPREGWRVWVDDEDVLLIWDGTVWVSVDAAFIAFTPAGGIAATDVQAAIEELDAEKYAKIVGLSASAAYSWFHFADNSTIAGGTTHDFSVTRPAVPASTKKPMTLDVIARNNAFASSHRVIFEGILSREASTTTEWATGRTVLGSAIDVDIPGNSEHLRLSVSAVAADGSSFTLSVENTSGDDYHVQVILKP